MQKQIANYSNKFCFEFIFTNLQWDTHFGSACLSAFTNLRRHLQSVTNSYRLSFTSKWEIRILNVNLICLVFVTNFTKTNFKCTHWNFIWVMAVFQRTEVILWIALGMGQQIGPCCILTRLRWIFEFGYWSSFSLGSWSVPALHSP